MTDQEDREMAVKYFLFYGQIAILIYMIFFAIYAARPHIISLYTLVTARDVTAHAMTWVVIAISAIVMRLKVTMKTMLKADVHQAIWLSIQTFLAAIFTFSVSELFFQITYATTLSWHEIVMLFWSVSLTLITISIGIIVPIISKTFSFFNRKRLLISLLLIAFAFSLWQISGMHVTINLVTAKNTMLYGDFNTNLVEISTWILVTMLFAWSFQLPKQVLHNH